MTGLSKLARWLFVLICGSLLAPIVAQAADAPQFRVDPFWPTTLPNNWIMGQVAGVAIDEDDNVWIVQRPMSITEDERGASLDPPRSKCCVAAPPVIVFDPEGNVVRAWGGAGEGYDWPTNEHGIQIGPDGNIWLGGNGANDGMVLKFTPEGELLLQIGKSGPPAGSAAIDQLGGPANLAFDAKAREVYVADGYANHRIIVFDVDTGAFKRMWGAYGNTPSDDALPLYNPDAPQFANPVHCVKVGENGLVYVCDRSNNRLQIFEKDGTFLRQFVFEEASQGSGSVWDLEFWPRNNQAYLLVVDGTNNEVHVANIADGNVRASFGHSGRNAGDFHWVHNVAVDSEGNLFTAEVDNAKRVQKWVPTEGP